MRNVSPPPPEPPRKTQKISRLLATRLKLVRVELIGHEHASLARTGSLVVYGPILAVGYAFVLAAAGRLLGHAVGWGPALFLIGVAHLGVGIFGMRREKLEMTTQVHDVVEPDCEANDLSAESPRAHRPSSSLKLPPPAGSPAMAQQPKKATKEIPKIKSERLPEIADQTVVTSTGDISRLSIG